MGPLVFVLEASGSDKPATTYIVSVFDKAHLRAILTNKDEGEALALERAMIQDGAKTRVEQIPPKMKKRLGPLPSPHPS